jgi:hypothetical protein
MRTLHPLGETAQVQNERFAKVVRPPMGQQRPSDAHLCEYHAVLQFKGTLRIPCQSCAAMNMEVTNPDLLIQNPCHLRTGILTMDDVVTCLRSSMPGICLSKFFDMLRPLLGALTIRTLCSADRAQARLPSRHVIHTGDHRLSIRIRQSTSRALCLMLPLSYVAWTMHVLDGI